MADHDPYDLKGQQLAQEERKDKEQALQALWDSDVRWLMGGKKGRRVVFRILEKAGAFRSVFSTNNAQMAFNEGQRNIGLFLLGAINRLCPETYLTMLEEHGVTDDRHGSGNRTT